MSWESLTTRGGNRPSFAGASTSTAGLVAKSVPTGGRRRGFRLGKGRRGVNQLARKVNNIQRRIALETQVNAFDQNFGTGVGSTGTIQEISNIPGGTLPNTRDGNTVNAKSLYMKLAINTPAAATVNAIARLMVFIDRSSNGAKPAVLDVLSAANVNAPLNYANKGRFYVLIDRTYALAVSNQDIIVDKFYKKMRDLAITFISSGSAVTDLGTNQLYVLMLTDQSTNLPTFAWYTRLKYIP